MGYSGRRNRVFLRSESWAVRWSSPSPFRSSKPYLHTAQQKPGWVGGRLHVCVFWCRLWKYNNIWYALHDRRSEASSLNYTQPKSISHPTHSGTTEIVCHFSVSYFVGSFSLSLCLSLSLFVSRCLSLSRSRALSLSRSLSLIHTHTHKFTTTKM